HDVRGRGRFARQAPRRLRRAVPRAVLRRGRPRGDAVARGRRRRRAHGRRVASRLDEGGRARPAEAARPRAVAHAGPGEGLSVPPGQRRSFASRRERLGRGEARIITGGTTAGSLWQSLVDAHPSVARVRVRYAVNERYVEPDHVLADGDEIAFFPPVSGG